MNIALIGYGRMGHEIESIATSRNHVVKLIIDQDNLSDLNETKMKSIDVVIEFSSPDSAYNNIVRCLKMNVPVVSGTTGWLEHYDDAVKVCRDHNCAFIHSSNFSIGVNILFRLNSELAKLMELHPEYSPSIEEIHHTKKLDSPSGTAITLANGIAGQNKEFNGWCPENNKVDGKIPVTSIREGNVPGIHSIVWDSEVDTISLRHESKSRKGLALGAVIAAEYISSRKGIFTMNDILGF